MKVATIFTVLTALFLFAAGSVLAAEKGKPQTRCPLMGGEINKEVFVDHEGQRIYFCCPSCIPNFNKDPAGYLKKMKEQGILPEKTPKPQTRCPVMGGEINKDVFVDHQGKRVYFCCDQCTAKFKEDPAGYIKKLEDQGITVENTPGLERHLRGASEGEKHQHQH